MLDLIIALSAAGLAVLLTLQPWKWVWQSRVIATLLPFAGIAFAPANGNLTVSLLLCGLGFYAAVRAVQALLPANQTIRDFTSKLRPSGSRKLPGYLVNWATLKVVGIVLIFKNPADETEAAAVREQRITARDGALEAGRSVKAALGFGWVHWIAVGEVLAITFLLQLAHLASPATGFSLSVPVVIVTMAYLVYRQAPDFGPPVASPHTYINVAN